MQWNDTNGIARVSSVDNILSVGRRHQALHSGITVTVWISSRHGSDSGGGVNKRHRTAPETTDPRFGLTSLPLERNDRTSTLLIMCMFMSVFQSSSQIWVWGGGYRLRRRPTGRLES